MKKESDTNRASDLAGILLSLQPGMKKSSYLVRLPKAAQRRGKAAEGQIEIVTARKAMKRIDAENADELKGSALGRKSKRIGILLEDDIHLIVRDPVLYPSGATGCPMRVIGKTQFDGVNGVVVLAHCEGRIFLRRIFRHATRAWELETIRGRRETGATPRGTARKETKEELGYPIRKLVRLGVIYPETALLASNLEIFWAELGPGPRKDRPEAKEAFGEIEKLTPQELVERIASGEIRDGYTISALMLAQLAGLIDPLGRGRVDGPSETVVAPTSLTESNYVA